MTPEAVDLSPWPLCMKRSSGPVACRSNYERRRWPLQSGGHLSAIAAGRQTVDAQRARRGRSGDGIGANAASAYTLPWQW